MKDISTCVSCGIRQIPDNDTCESCQLCWLCLGVWRRELYHLEWAKALASMSEIVIDE